MSQNQGAGFHTVRGYQLLKQQGGQLTPAMEDYLEMVYRLCQSTAFTRIGKLSEALHVRPSSVSKMILKLSELGYINYDRYEVILLTEKGKTAGAYLLYRHQTIEKFLKLIGKTESLEEAELIEHVLSGETVSLLSRLLTFFAQDADAQRKFEDFQAFSRTEQAPYTK
jgi:Mn-dependent DtxR family transcriptional regulator